MKSVKFALILFLFILSGVAGLIYQVAWFKHLSYFLGNATYSQAIVLATFMGGLAIGAWWWGKKADSSISPLRLFAILEFLIAVYCYAYYHIFDFVKEGFLSFVLARQWASDSVEVLFLKFIVSASTILIPTILMGGTLPVLVKYLSGKLEDVGKNVSVLYFINSFGAVIGSLLAGFYLLQYVGLRNTVYIGASFDLFVAIVFAAIVFFESSKVNTVSGGSALKQVKQTSDVYLIDSKKLYNILLLIAGISGVSAMIYEVAWLRLLIPILSSTTYSFTIILTVFILGITLGSFFIYLFISRIKKPLRFIAFCQLGIVISIALTLPYYERIPFLIWNAIGDGLNSIDYTSYLSLQFFYVASMLIIPTVFMGMSLPVATKLVVSRIENSGRDVGRVFALNTVGTVVGSLAAGLVLIPFIGILKTIEIGMLINLTGALLILMHKGVVQKQTKFILSFIILLSLIYYYNKVYSSNWVNSIMTSEVPRKLNRIKAPKTFDQYLNLINEHDTILYYNEGISGTIIVGRKNEEIYLYTNGKGDASSIGDLRTQVSLGQTPMILHNSPDTVLVIGFGAGTTIGNVLTHSRVKYAEVAEISPEVIEASVFFEQINQNPLADKRLRVIKDDGVSALRLSPHRYDVIISQPSNPWSAGVGNLFTLDFFEDCKRKLRPNGFVAQWFSLYEMDDESLRLIIRTAKTVFKHISMWQIGKSDILFICSEDPFQFNLKQMKVNFTEVYSILDKVNIKTFTAFLSQQFLQSNMLLEQYAGMGPINTENFPLLELWVPEAYFYNKSPIDFKQIDERLQYSHNAKLLLNDYEMEFGLTPEDYLHIGLFQSTGGNKTFGFEMAKKNPIVYVSWARNEMINGNNKKAIEYLSAVIDLTDSIPEVYQLLAECYIRLNDISNAKKILTAGVSKGAVNSMVYYLFGTLLLGEGDLNNAEEYFIKAIALDENNLEAINNLSSIYGKKGNYKAAIKLLDVAIENNANYQKFFQNRGYAKSLLGMHAAAIDDYSAAIEIDSNYGIAYYYRAESFFALQNHNRACGDWKKAYSLGVQQSENRITMNCR